MHILLTCEDYLPHIGGAEMCVVNLQSEFERRGHRVTVFTNTMATHENDRQSVKRVPWNFTIKKIVMNIKALWKCIGEADIVHSQYCFRLAALSSLIARMKGKPMILTQQGKGIVPEAGTRMVHRPLLWLCKILSLRFSTHVTSTSREITDLTAKFIPRSKITDISNGFDARRFRPDTTLPMPAEFLSCPPDVKKILTVRRLNPKNGIHILIQALGIVRMENPNFHYFAIGDGIMRSQIQDLVRENDLEKYVTLLGKRSNESLVSYYQHADLVVMPSSAEATSMSCIEAMGMGKPVIASRVGGLIDLIGSDNERGILVDIYGSEACTYDPPYRLPYEKLRPLSEALKAFLDHPESVAHRTEVAAKFVQSAFTWESVTNRYLDLYQTLV